MSKPTVELADASIITDDNGVPSLAMGRRSDGNILSTRIVRVDVEAQTIETRNTIYKVTSWHDNKSLVKV